MACAWNNFQSEISRSHKAVVKLHYKCETLRYSNDMSQRNRIFSMKYSSGSSASERDRALLASVDSH